MAVSPNAAGGSKIAVFSDVHSNWHALQAVLERCAALGVSRFYCLGDIVGYGANPGECLRAIRDLECPTVLGNHDESVAFGSRDSDLNPLARQGVEFSIKVLSDTEKAWLRHLPMTVTDGPATVVHASLVAPREWLYILDDIDALACVEKQTTPVCFFGHTHRAALYWDEGRGNPEKLDGTHLRLPPEGRTLINPGSVGQPRDGNPRSRFLVFDPAELTVEIVRVAYDVNGAANAILEAGLPPMLATRLLHGR